MHMVRQQRLRKEQQLADAHTDAGGSVHSTAAVPLECRPYTFSVQPNHCCTTSRSYRGTSLRNSGARIFRQLKAGHTNEGDVVRE